MTVSDETLNAFHDRALPPDEMARVGGMVAADPNLSERLAALAAADQLAQSRFAAALAEPASLALVRAIVAAPGPERPATAGPPWHEAWRRAAVGAVLGLVVGAGTMFWAAPRLSPAPPAADWIAQVADYHRVYAAEDRHLVEVDASETAHIEEWLGDRIGRRFRVPDLTPHGLTFRGARLLVAAGAPVAQLVYVGPGGGVVALCLTPRPDAPDAPPSPRPLGDLAAMVWRDGGTAFVLVAPASLDGLPQIAGTAGQSL